MSECKKCYQAAAGRQYINKYVELIDHKRAASREILAHRGNIIFINTPISFPCDICGACNYSPVFWRQNKYYYLEIDRPIELKYNLCEYEGNIILVNRPALNTCACGRKTFPILIKLNNDNGEIVGCFMSGGKLVLIKTTGGNARLYANADIQSQHCPLNHKIELYNSIKFE